MDCATAQEALSALMDGETPGIDLERLATHLTTCEGCRVWQERAHQLTRRVRLQAAPTMSPSDARARVLAAAELPLARHRRLPALVLERAGLLLVGLAQLVVSLPMLVLGQDHLAPVHVAHEMGSLDAAIGVGFLAAALRPWRAAGMRVVLGVAATLLVATALVDLISGQTSPADEAPHLLVVAGWLLLLRVGARVSPLGDRRSDWVRAAWQAIGSPLRPRHLVDRGGKDQAGSGGAAARTNREQVAS